MKLKKPFILLLILCSSLHSQQNKSNNNEINISGFYDSSHHWYDINDENKIISPVKNQPRFKKNDIINIAENILLFQKENGGWAKNYDMLAILKDEQKEIIRKNKTILNTTFDNGATYSHTEYLAKVFFVTNDKRYKTGFLNGLEFILSAQYPNGGWPQFFPDTSGYQKHITFNDGAMIGIMKLLQKIVNNDPKFSFIETNARARIKLAFNKGIENILNCQINDNGKLTVWCQQHDHITFEPRGARTFELASICNMESAEIVEFLMSLANPDERVIRSVNSAVEWFELSKISGIKVKTIESEQTDYKYHSTNLDKVVVEDPDAPYIWTRFTELGTQRQLFCNRDGKKVYSMSEVERERRTGYAWYTYAPQSILNFYKTWQAAKK
ncbi:MAG: pectate lyase [Melioribacteraceae bacterium]|nr:pectate lyase [Melioribacteraceae bacterium]